ncbi:hypothetical protein RJ640_013302 [Escallonia rubra]|uniref:Uncharacterized protein n=1 Tax=Escallonia rubra TaxID=112253 RepID=A0AA88QZ95_9ASTE|nr:hypothetical protein RJ640_013302 [Escallonia rubra]
MLSVEETQSFALSMETRVDIKSDRVYFQFAIQYSNVYQADISRVITVRMPTVDSVPAYLESVHDEVTAVPNGGKDCIYRYALPPGYVLKSQMKALLEEEADKIAIEDEIENQWSRVVSLDQMLACSWMILMLMHLKITTEKKKLIRFIEMDDGRDMRKRLLIPISDFGV